ncbi:Murein L,D-transpeptidase YcbB/YkuD [Flavobacterium fluvii]|uniref:Murein L,D-transpeptidase YcbB/YkuD n=1 Tax=Flavobacterium fluvii TaxID=468056 RepID=A0A1M5G282_9FLAO|nr:L,D-transpeptidase family protein [Flavobacterium fluvii]SHF97816.1 Murein L,D-transpeptidase YcbB/YkuD [Flavobacterium fluvii]
MNRFFILVLLFSIFSCKKEVIKKEVTPKTPKTSTFVPTIQPEGKSFPVDSLLLIPFNSKVLKEFYMSTGYRTIWQSKENRGIILKYLIASEEEGLNPADYNITKLQKYERKRAVLSSNEIVNYDVLLTRSFQKYISHLTTGKLNPRALYPDWDLKENKIDINQTIAGMLKSDSLDYKIEQLKPNHIVYKKLKKALEIIDDLPNDTFARIETSNKIVANDTNPSLIDIKKRLIYWKDLQSKDSLSNVYDSRTIEAVKKFQFRHGLSADGVIGKGTIESLNYSKEQRKGQILANLERWKWFPRDMGNEYIIINIPEYKLRLINGEDTIRMYKVIVGRVERKTPILSSKLTHAIFNPTWTVPPTILKEDVIPSISKDLNYLVQTNIKIYDGNGDTVLAKDWTLSKANSYRYVQSPGTFNSLGMVKLTFPNRFSVYLHDTNHRDYFTKSMRSLSSGCVRVDKPLELAEYLLDDPAYWNLEKITETLQSEKTKQIALKKELPIHILYWTAWSKNNKLIFREDIYKLDADLYDKLRK